MYELLLVMLFGFLVFRSSYKHQDELSELPRRITDKIGKLWDIAHLSMRENRFVRAEKALLTILKIDEKNAAAYNRLGILYAKQRQYHDAIDCFEIASSIEPTASSLHNLGLIYYETENYTKAATAFEQALNLEEELAARHIAYAKVQEKLGSTKLVLQELERAVELEPTNESFTLLQKAYEHAEMPEEAEKVARQLKKLIAKPGQQPRRVVRPKRVAI